MSQEKPNDASPAPDKHGRHTGIRLGIELGERMFLDLLGSDDTAEKRRIPAELIGVVHFEFLALRLPWMPGLRTHLIPGSMVTVRFVGAGDLFGFHVEVLSHTVKPALIVFLSYPEVVEKLTLRQHRRVHCALPVQICGRRGETVGLISDLSRGGCRLALDVRGHVELRKVMVGDELVLRSVFNADGVPQSATCVVRVVDMDVSRIALGISFTDADQAFWKALDTFLELYHLLC